MRKKLISIFPELAGKLNKASEAQIKELFEAYEAEESLELVLRQQEEVVEKEQLPVEIPEWALNMMKKKTTSFWCTEPGNNDPAW